MSSAAAQTYLTPEEYLAWERKSDTKHEYWGGEIIAMSGASHAHSLIVTNISGELYIQLKGERVKSTPTIYEFGPVQKPPTSIRISLSSVVNHALRITLLIHCST